MYARLTFQPRVNVVLPLALFTYTRNAWQNLHGMDYLGRGATGACMTHQAGHLPLEKIGKAFG